MSEEGSPTTESAPAAEPQPPKQSARARAGSYYRNTRYLLSLGLIAYGIWNFRDGFYKWPAENAAAQKAGYDKMPHSDMDLNFNRTLAFVCPLVGLAMLAWALHTSRGEFKVENDTLYVPGHPPITGDQIEALDKTKWDRKGIAVVTYRRDNGKESEFLLDDFVYERDGIDDIFYWVEWSLNQPRKPKPVPSAPPPSTGVRPPTPPPPPPRRA